MHPLRASQPIPAPLWRCGYSVSTRSEHIVGAGPSHLPCFARVRPTDAAFARTLSYFNMSAEELLSDVPLLRAVLGFHVLPMLARAADVPAQLTCMDTLTYGG